MHYNMRSTPYLGREIYSPNWIFSLHDLVQGTNYPNDEELSTKTLLTHEKTVPTLASQTHTNMSTLRPALTEDKNIQRRPNQPQQKTRPVIAPLPSDLTAPRLLEAYPNSPNNASRNWTDLNRYSPASMED